MRRPDEKGGKSHTPWRFSPRNVRRGLIVAGVLAASAGATAAIASGCSGWDPSEPFTRNAPEVERARGDLDSGAYTSAEQILEKYLDTGACADGGIGLPDTVRQKSGGSFDLGLTLFHLAEHFGNRFGEEETPGDDTPGAPDKKAPLRSAEIDCALVIVKAIASDTKVPMELRARAYYLAGNLEFLRRKYEDAVKLYDQALALVPGIVVEAGGDGIGRDAAWNRAIALRRIEDQKDAGQDGSDGSDGDDGADGADSNDAPDSADAPDGSDADSGDRPDGDKDSGGEDSGDKGDAPADAQGDAAPRDGGEDGGAPKDDKKGEPPPPTQPPKQQQEDRILDQLEEAPTYQEEEAKKRAGQRRGGRAMEDK